MAHRSACRPRVWSVSLAGLALAAGLIFQPVVGADFPGSRSGDCPNCPVNARYFGYYPTIWRRWPGTEPQPQPAPQQSPEQTQVPLVAPPPPAEEIENKSKPMGEGAGGGVTPDSVPKPGSATSADDAATKLPAGPPDRGTLPAPTDTPPKFNQFRNGIDRLPTFEDTPRDGGVTTSPNAQTWPPANVLRNEEIRANFQLPDRPLPPGTPATATQPRPMPAAASAGPWPPISGVKPAAADFPPANHLPAAPSTSNIEARGLCPSEPIVQPAKAMPLHWVEPANAGAIRKNRPNAPFGERPADAPRSDAKPQAESAAFGSNAARPSIDMPANAPLARVPFVPSRLPQHSLATVDPQALPFRGSPQGIVPADISGIGIAPPNKVSQISVPMIPSADAKAPPQPSPQSSQDNVTRIDPLAIGRSLAPSVLPDAGANSSRSVARENPPLSIGLQPPRATSGAPSSDHLVTEPAASPRPLRGNPLEARRSPPIVAATGPAMPSTAWPPAGSRASLLVSDGDLEGAVLPASYVGTDVTPQPPHGRTNPLRSPSPEVQGGGTPTIWKNPLR